MTINAIEKISLRGDFLLDNLACDQVRLSYYPNNIRMLRNAPHSQGPCSKEPGTLFPGTVATGGKLAHRHTGAAIPGESKAANDF
jgi:hypothetical protein